MLTSKCPLTVFHRLLFCLLLDMGDEVYDDVDASDFPPPPIEIR